MLSDQATQKSKEINSDRRQNSSLVGRIARDIP